MSLPLAATCWCRSSSALALNRAGRGDEAERVLRQLLETRGPSSETYGILGRVYKDRWEAAAKAGDRARSRAGCSSKRSTRTSKASRPTGATPIPGVNAVTLMELEEPAGPAPASS